MDNIRVLLVDDSPVFLSIAARFLKLFPGLDVVGVADGGNAALAEAGRLRPDLILIDLNMDDLPGLDAIPRLRQMIPECKIIALTLMDAATHRQASLDAGADEFVAKAAMEVDLFPSIQRIFSA